MTYVGQEARQDLLDTIADAIDELGMALAALGAAYEALDEESADRLEEQLFRPVQVAYGRAKRTHTGFAERHNLPTRTFEPALPGHPSQGVKGFLQGAVDAVMGADGGLSELQDSMLPVEVGDPELRAGLADVREHLASLESRSQDFLRTFGR